MPGGAAARRTASRADGGGGGGSERALGGERLVRARSCTATAARGRGDYFGRSRGQTDESGRTSAPRRDRRVKPQPLRATAQRRGRPAAHAPARHRSCVWYCQQGSDCEKSAPACRRSAAKVRRAMCNATASTSARKARIPGCLACMRVACWEKLLY